MESNNRLIPPAPSKWLPTLMAVVIFMQMLDATILNTALPKMAQDLNQSPLNMQSAVISYALTLALLMPASGYLCDRFGTKKVFIAALALFVAGSALCAAAPNLTVLVAARIIQGLGGAMLVPVPRLVVLRAYDKSRLLQTMNYIIMPALLGPILGPVLGGYLVDYAGWHWIFLINLPIGAAALWLSSRIMPDFYAPAGGNPRFDTPGFLLFALAAVGLSLAVEILSQNGSPLAAALCLLLGLFGLYRFRLHARQDGERSLYPPRLFLVRTFRIGIIGNLLSRLGMAAMPFLMPLLLQVAFGRSASTAGWVLAPVGLAALLMKPLIKPLMDRLGYRTVLVWNTRLIGLIIMSFALPDASTPLWLLMPMLFVLGLCNSLQYSAMNTLTIADLRPAHAGSGNSLMAVNQQLAISFGIALGAVLLNTFRSWPAAAPEIHDAFRYTFMTIGSITFASACVFARLHPRDGANLIRPAGAV
ncbi:DHA2 family efflux MFS transporter permease subunit [Neisseria leonii]|uniref:DHA2 family efflux MFS transporter permease subunit n=1 Tax=Neisseria leonii TaxID=2995413 RepID=A0A9X4E0H7_9NEIS|nr:DHA2 family efflux MFS transporter permease subunit [Neisseria sp. 51.81]MDD9327217.1 DHA2 family efflux MFS transporter permease subunit [Neisseria sp. 51.81]